jgi:hypothetical protein
VPYQGLSEIKRHRSLQARQMALCCQDVAQEGLERA